VGAGGGGEHKNLLRFQFQCRRSEKLISLEDETQDVMGERGGMSEESSGCVWGWE